MSMSQFNKYYVWASAEHKLQPEVMETISSFAARKIYAAHNKIDIFSVMACRYEERQNNAT